MALQLGLICALLILLILKVAEDQALVAYIKDKFNAYKIGTDFMEATAQTSWPLMPAPLENLDELSTVTVNHMIYEDPKPGYGVKSTNNELPPNNQTMPVCLVQDPFHISGEESLDIVKFTEENQFRFQSVDLMEVSKPLHQSLHEIESEMMEGSMVGLSTLEDDIYNTAIFGDLALLAMNSFSDGDLMEHTLEEKDADNRGREIVKTFFSFPTDCELHTSPGPGLLEQEAKDYLWDPYLANENACYSSSKNLYRDLSHGIEPSTGLFAKREDAERGLEAVVPDMHSSLNDELSNNSKNTEFSVASLGQFAASKNAEIPSKEGAFVEDKRVPWSSKTTACGVRAPNAVIESPPTSFESMVSTLTEEERQKKGYGCMQIRKGSKISHVGKRRSKPGENKKPRPRDRQLIQDRVKELRELVPNGSKVRVF